jgi:hypothetical protein
MRSFFSTGSNTETFQHDFTGRKPSRAQVMAKINALIKSGARSISVTWGENWIELDHLGGQLGSWSGSGWLRDIGGDDIAQELNRAQARANNATLNLWNS